MDEGRNEAMVREREAGMTLAQIGGRHGVTRERVRQVLKACGGPSFDEVQAQREQRAAERRAELAPTLVYLLVDNPGIDREGLAALAGCTADEAVEALGPAAALLVAQRQHPGRRFALSYILDVLRRAHAISGKPLTMPFYESVADDLGGPSAVRILQVFGSWTAACQAAGVPSCKSPRATYTRRWTPEQMLRHVADYLLELHDGSYTGYDAWSRTRPQAPSAQTVRNEFGAWSSIKAQALTVAFAA